MITSLRRLRPMKRQILVLCLVTVGTIWFHHSTNIQIIGSVYQSGKVSARLGIVYEWMKYNPQLEPDPPQVKPSSYHQSLSTGRSSRGSTLASRNFASENNTATEDKTETDIDIDVDVDNSESHPFDNLCQYPVLNPQDESLNHVIKHMRLHVCKKVQEEILKFDYDGGELIFDRSLADRLYPNRKLRCQFRPFSGGIRPRITDYSPIGQWIPVTKDRTKIDNDLIETKCFAAPKSIPKSAIKNKHEPRGDEEIFRFAFGHIAKRNATGGKNPRAYLKNDESTLSIDFLFLDSTSYNTMRRHMPKTWRYMKEVMGFYHLEGYTKVGDNSMVNLMPILAGLRYGTQAQDMPTEVIVDRPIDVEPLPFLWKFFRERGCATLFNDDIADYTRGFLNYPWTHVKGFAEYPTDHFARPWHIYQQRYPLPDSSKYCFGNYPYVKLQLNFLEQMIKKYKDTCHFSFNFITDLPHDDPNNLELADDDLHSLLQRLYTDDYLNNTVLFVMGDHGNRIGYVMYTYVGRIEERMTLFSVYFPEWYRRKYPEAMRRLEINKHRLTSNYDVYRMINEIFNDTLSAKVEPPLDSKLAVSKGVSLFRPINANRTCRDANVPPQHCVCLEPVPSWSASSKLSRSTLNDTLYQWSKETVFNWTRLQLQTHPQCSDVRRIDILSIRTLTTNQMIQHGVRDQSPDQMKKLQRKLDGDIEYVDLIFKMQPIDVTARTRLQYYKKPFNKKKLFINVAPHFYSTNDHNATFERGHKCVKNQTAVPWFCRCLTKI